MILLQAVGDGVEQVGLAQSRIAVDKQGVIVGPGPLRNRVGGGIGQFVVGPHHIGLEGEGPAVPGVSGMVGLNAVVGGKLVIVEDFYLKIRRKQVPQGVPDIGQKPGLNGFLLKLVAAVQHKGGVLHGHHLHLVKPGIDGGRGQLGRHPLQYAAPYI